MILSTNLLESLIKLLLDAIEPISYTGEFCVLITRQIFKGSEAVAERCSVKKLFLKILQNSQENTCARVC